MFSDFLNKTKGFKYQIIVKVLLKKYKPDGEIEFRSIYFNSTTKTVIRHKFGLKNSFQGVCTELITGLMKDLVGLLNQSSLNKLTFQFIDRYQGVLT